MARGTPHSAEARAVALADLVTGASLTATARKFGIARATLAAWRQAAVLPAPSTSQREKREEIGEQLFDYLQASIATLAVQVRAFGDRAWLAKQPAGELAILHGVIADKTVRLLQALRGDAADQPQ